MKNAYFLLLASAFLAVSCGPSKSLRQRTEVPHNVRVLIHTTEGDMVVRLYDSTPLHRDNFVRLVRSKFYDSLLFHRVIPGFMIQGGDPESKRAAQGNKLGDGGADMPRIKAEILPQYINKRGALAAARDNNPEKASSASQFYIVTGKTFDTTALRKVEERTKMKMSEADRRIYETQGGAPWLDGSYTVFGEVESGMEVADKIAREPKDALDRPRKDIRMTMTILPQARETHRRH